MNSEQQTIVGVSPDQQTTRFLTFVKDGDAAEIHIHSASASGVWIRVPWSEFVKLQLSSDGEITSQDDDSDTKRKVLRFAMQEKQMLYIHTINDEEDEGSGWAIFVSRDKLLESLSSMI